MRKLVPESIEETLWLKNKNVINEGVVGDFLNKGKGLIQGIFKKVGNYFVALFQDKIIPAIVPANIGIAFKEGKLPKGVQFVPSQTDIRLAPSLTNLKRSSILERVQRGYLEDAKKNKARRKLAKYWTNPELLYNTIQLTEAKVELPYPTEGKKAKVIDVNREFLVKMINLAYRDTSLTPILIWGAPGIGKTTITKAVVQSLGPGHRCIDVQTSKMTPDDWTLPAIRKGKTIPGIGKMTGAIGYSEEGTIRSVDIPKNWLPVYLPTENDPEFEGIDEEEDARRNDIANHGEGGIIFLDELSRAAAEVQNTCLKLAHEKIVGDYKLGSKWAIVAATNRESDDPAGGQTQIGSALLDRFQNYNFVPTVDEWLEWAAEEKIDPRIRIFVEFNRDHYYYFDADDIVNTTPRSWEALSHILAATQKYGDLTFNRSDINNIMKGNLSSKTVAELTSFLALIENFPPESILMVLNNPAKAPKLTKKGAQGVDVVQAKALIAAVCSQSRDMKLTAQQVENYVQYFIDVADKSISATALKLLVTTHDYINLETGDIKGKDKYKKAMDMYRAAFGPAIYKDIMKQYEKDKK